MGKTYYFNFSEPLKKSSVMKPKKSCFFKNPYISENLGSQPIYIESKEDKRRLMAEQNLEEI